MCRQMAKSSDITTAAATMTGQLDSLLSATFAKSGTIRCGEQFNPIFHLPSTATIREYYAGRLLSAFTKNGADLWVYNPDKDSLEEVSKESVHDVARVMKVMPFRKYAAATRAQPASAASDVKSIGSVSKLAASNHGAGSAAAAASKSPLTDSMRAMRIDDGEGSTASKIGSGAVVFEEAAFTSVKPPQPTASHKPCPLCPAPNVTRRPMYLQAIHDAKKLFDVKEMSFVEACLAAKDIFDGIKIVMTLDELSDHFWYHNPTGDAAITCHAYNLSTMGGADALQYRRAIGWGYTEDVKAESAHHPVSASATATAAKVPARVALPGWKWTPMRIPEYNQAYESFGCIGCAACYEWRSTLNPEPSYVNGRRVGMSVVGELVLLATIHARADAASSERGMLENLLKTRAGSVGSASAAATNSTIKPAASNEQVPSAPVVRMEDGKASIVGGKANDPVHHNGKTYANGAAAIAAVNGAQKAAAKPDTQMDGYSLVITKYDRPATSVCGTITEQEVSRMVDEDAKIRSLTLRGSTINCVVFRSTVGPNRLCIGTMYQLIEIALESKRRPFEEESAALEYGCDYTALFGGVKNPSLSILYTNDSRGSAHHIQKKVRTKWKADNPQGMIYIRGHCDRNVVSMGSYCSFFPWVKRWVELVGTEEASDVMD